MLWFGDLDHQQDPVSIIWMSLLPNVDNFFLIQKAVYPESFIEMHQEIFERVGVFTKLQERAPMLRVLEGLWSKTSGNCWHDILMG